MRSQLLYAFEVLAIALQASALQMPLGRTAPLRRRRSLYPREVDLTSSQHASLIQNRDDLAYYVNITLGSQTHAITLDTGSTDLWIPQPTDDFVTVNTTTVTANITYVKGTVSGPIHFAEMSLAGITIPSQAFISVIESADLHETGIMGLGFMSHSPISKALSYAYGTETSKELSRTPIHNIFHQNPSLPSFFTLLLGRLNDPGNEQYGAFTIGEYLPQYASIEHSSKLMNMREDHWAILVDEIRVGNQPLPLNSSVPSTPQGKALAVIDSGFSLSPLPLSVIDRLYGSIPGALPMLPAPGNNVEGHWLLPCDHVAELSITIAGIEFPVNPADIINMMNVTIHGAEERYAICMNAFQASESALGPDFAGDADMILGASFLKNAYVAYHYGSMNSSGEFNDTSFAQLLPTTDIRKARQEFSSVRAAQTAHYNATVLSPADFLSKITQIPNTTTSGSGDAESDTDADAPPVRGVLSTQGTNDNSNFSDLVTKFGPVIVGLLAGNVFLLIVVCSIAVYMCVTRSGKSPSTRALPTTYQPLDLGGASEKQQLEPVFAGRYDA